MMKRCIKILILISSVSIVLVSCEKDDKNTNPDNPTNGKTTAVFNPNITYGSMTDQDGNVYKTVTIGTQTWMAENLRTTKYNDGTAIPLVTDSAAWENLTGPGYCNYNNTTSLETIATYGRLYNWFSVETGKLAPKGWHVPSEEEWTILTGYLGGETTAGGKLKETGTTHWTNPNTGATNETGFTALPGGAREHNSPFNYFGYYSFWWNATVSNTNEAWYRYIGNDNIIVRRIYNPKQIGFSVRCVKD